MAVSKLAKEIGDMIAHEIVKGIFGMEEVQWTWFRHEDCGKCLYLEDLDPEEDGGEDHVFCMHEKRQNIQTIEPRPEPCPYWVDHVNGDNRPKPRSFDQQFEDLITARVPEREPSPSITSSMSISPSESPSPIPIGTGPGKWEHTLPDGRIINNENFDEDEEEGK